MSAWSEGYTSEIDYVTTYISSMSTAHIRQQLLANHIEPPVIRTACELGFGMGVSVNVHAAVSTAQWWGTDFNPSHVAAARAMSGSLNAAKLFDQSFRDFCQRDDLPEFDCIGLHGIWSWISDENRHIIVDFIQRKLAVGGVLYISYNTLPGWATKAPLRHLFSQYAATMGTVNAGKAVAFEQARAFADSLLPLCHRLQQQNPDMAQHLEGLKNKEASYLVHEYLNADFQPMYFSQVHQWLDAAKLTFACVDSFADSYAPCQFNAQQLELLQSITDPVLQQSVQDYLRNTMFRRDYWVRGARRLSAAQVQDMLQDDRVQLQNPRQEVQDGRIQPAEVLQQLLDVLEDKRVYTLKDVAAAMPDLAFTNLYRILHLLAGGGHVRFLQSEAAAQTVMPQCQQFNQHVLTQRLYQPAGHTYLASAAMGTGISVAYVDTLFTAAWLHDKRTVQDLAAYVADVLKRTNQSLIKDGQTISEEAATIAELERLATSFISGTVEQLTLLGILP